MNINREIIRKARADLEDQMKHAMVTASFYTRLYPSDSFTSAFGKEHDKISTEIVIRILPNNTWQYVDPLPHQE